MGGVQISGNIKKESVRIDPSGNIINPRTREVIKPLEPEYNAPLEVKSEKIEPKSKIDEMINKLVEKKVAEIVEKKIAQALENL